MSCEMPRRVDRLWVTFGQQVRDARDAKRLTVRELANRAGISAAMLYRVEAGEPASTDLAAAVANALGRRAELHLVDRRRTEPRQSLSADAVHSAMGEFEARHLRRLGFQVGIDEPYQHYQFAGRADVVAWDVSVRAMVHIENRTRFPDIQEMAGAFNAKRAYLGQALATRVGIARWASETHVVAALWSAEVLHALRMRPDSFRSICPNGPDAITMWWGGRPPETGSTTSCLIVVDPFAATRQRTFIGLEEAIAGARPRYRGYADAASRAQKNGPR
jgi:transcriptional regulator with XRE-family HTH domain